MLEQITSKIKEYENSVAGKRVKSFFWRAGAVGLASIVNFVSVNVAELGLPDWGVVIVGLVFGEITKYLNTK